MQIKRELVVLGVIRTEGVQEVAVADRQPAQDLLDLITGTILFAILAGYCQTSGYKS